MQRAKENGSLSLEDISAYSAVENQVFQNMFDFMDYAYLGELTYITEEEFDNLINAVNLKREQLIEALKGSYDTTVVISKDFLALNTDYNEGLSEEEKVGIQTLISNINEEIANELGTDNTKIGNYVNGIVDLVSNDKTVSDAISKLFTVDFSQMDVETANREINKYINIIANALGESPEDRKVSV